MKELDKGAREERGPVAYVTALRVRVCVRAHPPDCDEDACLGGSVVIRLKNTININPLRALRTRTGRGT